MISDIPISDIDGFPNHPFCVQDDEDMVQLVESIKERGVETSALVRLKKDGRYELISGHRRKRACEILGLETYTKRYFFISLLLLQMLNLSYSEK